MTLAKMITLSLVALSNRMQTCKSQDSWRHGSLINNIIPSKTNNTQSAQKMNDVRQRVYGTLVEKAIPINVEASLIHRRLDDGDNAGENDGNEEDEGNDDGGEGNEGNEGEDESEEEENEVEDEEEDAENDGEDGNNQKNYGFSIINYSLKFLQCQTVETFSDEMAQDENADNVLIARRFVVFRLCRSKNCDNDYRGGCEDDYGEYVIDLADWLETMQEYKEERNDAFCDYCDNNQCWQNNNNNDDEDDNKDGDDGSCQWADECYEKYHRLCGDGDDDSYVEYSDFFECGLYESQGGDDAGNSDLYVGPRCGSDGRTIVIGLYYDEYCSSYAGYEKDIVEYTGTDFAEDGLMDYYNTDCISCRESKLPFEYNNDGYFTISGVCEGTYQSSGKCETYLSVNDNNNYEEVVDPTCTFVYNILGGSYNELGQIYLEQSDESFYEMEIVTETQAFYLGLIMLICVALTMYAVALHLRIVSPPSKVVKGPIRHPLYHSHPSLDEGNYNPSFDSY